MDSGSQLTLNEPRFFAAAETGSIMVGRGALIHLSDDQFSFKSGAFIEIKDNAKLIISGGGGYAARNVQIECSDCIIN